MNADFAIALTRETLWTAIWIAAPILLISMLVGVLISVFQVVTQIQEMSLTFVPKVLAVILTLIAFGPWMMARFINFAQSMILSTPLLF